MGMNVLYAGDSPVGGPANYLLGILAFLKARVTHIPPGKTLTPTYFKTRYDAILLSDFSKKHLPAESERALVRQVKEGTGLLMIGGWGSFSGPFGGWKGSLVEKLLPVSCLGRDDRVNLPSGAFLIQKKKHPIVQSVSFKNPPVICGLNRIRPKKDAGVVLTAKGIAYDNRRGDSAGRPYPLLVVNRDPARRVAALATDLAPHWCGGMVDWGGGAMRLRVKKGVSIEVGRTYVRFVSGLIRWLTLKSNFGF